MPAETQWLMPPWHAFPGSSVQWWCWAAAATGKEGL